MPFDTILIMICTAIMVTVFILDWSTVSKYQVKLDEFDNRIRNLEIHELKAVVDQPGINTRCNDLENRIDTIERKIVLALLEALADEQEE